MVELMLKYLEVVMEQPIWMVPGFRILLLRHFAKHFLERFVASCLYILAIGFYWFANIFRHLDILFNKILELSYWFQNQVLELSSGIIILNPQSWFTLCNSVMLLTWWCLCINFVLVFQIGFKFFGQRILWFNLSEVFG